MSDIKKMIDLLESAERGQPTEEKVQFECRLDEEKDMWVLERSDGEIHGEYPTEAEASKVKSQLEEDEESLAEPDEEETLMEDEEREYESFWDAFEVDNRFYVHESNDTFCVLGDETNFHYGTHVTMGMAEAHVESLETFKNED